MSESTNANSTDAVALPNDAGRTVSLWMHTGGAPDFAPLERDLTVDVCVVGAGVAGLTIAYHLLRAGKSVAVLDDGPVAGGESGRTTGHLNSCIDDGLTETAARHGNDGARLAVESHRAAIETIERICRDEGFDGGVRRVPEYLFADPNASEQQDYLQKELDLAHELGFDAVHFADRAPLPGVETGRCLVWPDQGYLHAGKYYDGLADAVKKHGGQVFCHTRASKMQGGDDARVETRDGHAVRCNDAVVIATCSPTGGVFADLPAIHARQPGYRTFVIGVRVEPGTVEDAQFTDTLDPYHYARPQETDDGTILIVGGEDHKTGEADDAADRFDKLEEWTRQRWPAAGEVAFRWSGQVYEPDDYLGFIGRNPGDEENVFIATGDSGMGLTHGTIAGVLIPDLILGRENPYEKLYDPSRLSTANLKDLVKENADAAWQYADLLTPGEAKGADDVAAGCGATVRRGATKVAVYRDDAGALHEHTAICPHLGGVLHFNTAECTWDCPIHGSRFKATTGEVVDGPAGTDLAKA